MSTQSARVPADSPGPTHSTTEPYAPGDVVAQKYRLERKVGEGGMGAVWVAINVALETPVAIKVLRGCRPLNAPERLLREARATAQLRHPAIIRVFDFGVGAAGHPYIVMELLEGESLRSVLYREGRFSPERAVQVMLPVVDGLVAAHARGIIHRDLKPDNVFLATDDAGRLQPKILDFGVAKVMSSAAPGVTGVVAIGTPEYMSPEQAMALEDVDQRADIWAACAVLHELMTDEYTFDGSDVEQVMRAVVDAEPASLVEKAGVDEALWSIVERGLRKRREERWQTARELGQALATWLFDHGIDEDATGASLRSWLDATPGGSTSLHDRPISSGRKTPRESATAIGIGPSDERPPESPRPAAAQRSDPGVTTPPPQTLESPARWLPTALGAGRSRLAALAGAAALVTVGWTLARSSAVAEESPRVALPAGEAPVPGLGSPEEEAELASAPIRLDGPLELPATAATPSASSSAHPRAKTHPPKPRAIAPHPVTTSRPEDVDFGF